MEPPTWPVLFNVPNRARTNFEQVFENVDIFHHIAMRPAAQLYFVKHPTNGKFTRRHEALDLLQDVDETTARRIAQERVRLGLPGNILTVTDKLANRTATTQALARE